MGPLRIAIVGFGKIARDQHMPAIAADPDFTLTALVDPHTPAAGVPAFASLDGLIADGPAIDAVAICTPPQVRHALAAKALSHGLHVLLEKPPGATLAEVEVLTDLAAQHNVSLFAAWHSRFAAGVGPAKAWLADRIIQSVHIRWREDVRVWHPGQTWIWEPGGLGVFDPGINALSIATHILPRPFFLTEARLFMPANLHAPIAADLRFTDSAATPITADFDFRQEGPQSWDIIIETDAGTVKLAKGGAVLHLPDASHTAENREYAGLYQHFAALVRGRASDVEITPLRHVADAFLRGRHVIVDAFIE
jgi:D-galactose 1-dehydrogenase